MIFHHEENKVVVGARNNNGDTCWKRQKSRADPQGNPHALDSYTGNVCGLVPLLCPARLPADQLSNNMPRLTPTSYMIVLPDIRAVGSYA